MELLQKYIFIPLDIFKENQQNKDIKSKLDAWLVFLSMDNPEMIVKLIETYPEFKQCTNKSTISVEILRRSWRCFLKNYEN